jgi:putative thioredoxin
LFHKVFPAGLKDSIMIETVSSPYIHAATSDTFKGLVLDNSFKGPVLVNFWSRKAGPCLRQYPILDKVVHHYKGRFLLVNIDVDQEFIVTKEYGIASVPTLKLFRHGQVVATLHGFQSEKDLSEILEQYVVRDSDLALAKALQHYSQGHQAEAYEMMTDAIVADPLNPRLPLAMCKLLKHEKRYREALDLIDASPDWVRNNKEVAQFYAILGFYADEHRETTKDIDALIAHGETFPQDMDAKRQIATYYVIHEKYEQALQELVKIMDWDLNYNNKYAQKAMLKVFAILGTEHELVSKYRPYLKRYAH